MVTIVIIIGLLLAFVTGFFCAIKAVNLGLRWQIQTENKQEPIFNTPTLVPKPTVNTADIAKYSKDQMNEWMFGKDGG